LNLTKINSLEYSEVNSDVTVKMEWKRENEFETFWWSSNFI